MPKPVCHAATTTGAHWLLVDPTDLAPLGQVMGVCTCLWGRIYDPIIPVGSAERNLSLGRHLRRPRRRSGSLNCTVRRFCDVSL
jgi:hypothetical protein